MADLVATHSLYNMMNTISRRLRSLETAPRTSRAAIHQGGLQAYDDNVLALRMGELSGSEAGIALYSADGAQLVRLGRIGTDGDEVTVRALTVDRSTHGAHFGQFADYEGGGYRCGLRVNDAFGTSIAHVSSEFGVERPMVPSPPRKADDFYATTSGSFVPTWRAHAKAIAARYCLIEVFVLNGAGTSSEVKVSNGAKTGATQSVGSGASATLVWSWDLGELVQEHNFMIEARRTGGADNVYVYDPLVNLGRPDSPTTPTGV